ncbi:hypothetical protein [Comamonas sp. JC664]|uniref:hypothetical protein n=1 Tax=Comamonas sp. JC664 TaxID=2801917 RepID=UPI0017498901|nr:hypothetical protein [Comamonas sp. JC664]MBL0695688.1 hypothetical protein [Comamonas sp. JC664]GHG62936.1 hypothetical protein GCM10012319_02090 [Comamonas sp. KCTC 72670]
MTPSLLAASLILALGQTPESVATKASPPDDAFLQARLSLLAGDTDFGAPDANTRFHVALDARTAELTSGLRAEAALSLFVNPSGFQGLAFQDNASYFRLRYRPSSWAAHESLSLTAFPVSSTRLHMGYENPVVWGRQTTLIRREEGGEPGMELRLSRQRWEAFAAAKAPRLANGLTLEHERRLMFLAGAGLNLTRAFRAEIQAAHFGRPPSGAMSEGGKDLDLNTYGVSGRVQWRQGVPVGTNVDLALYEGDPTFFERFFAPEVYPGGFGAHLALEGSFVSQRLLDADASEPGITRRQPAHAAALVARFKWDLLRVHALAYYKTPAFIFIDMPGFPPGLALSNRMQPAAERSATLGADYHLRAWGLTPGLLLRATRPPSLTSAFATSGVLSGHAIIRDNRLLTFLPEGEEPGLILTTKATARWDLGEVAGVLAEVFYTRDPNRTRFEDDVTGTMRVVRESPHMAGGNLLLQVRL